MKLPTTQAQLIPFISIYILLIYKNFKKIFMKDFRKIYELIINRHFFTKRTFFVPLQPFRNTAGMVKMLSREHFYIICVCV